MKYSTLIVSFEEIIRYKQSSMGMPMNTNHKEGVNMSIAKFVVKMEESDVKDLQKKHVKHDAYAENMQKALENPNVDKKMLEYYQNKQEEALLAFEAAKGNMAKKYIPECIFDKHECEWIAKYEDCEMIVKVLCECGKAALDEAGISYEEV